MNRLEHFEKELERIGVDYESMGPVDSVCVVRQSGKYRFYDDGGEITLTEKQANNLFSKLPDNAGWERFWREVKP